MSIQTFRVASSATGELLKSFEIIFLTKKVVLGRDKVWRGQPARARCVRQGGSWGRRGTPGTRC